MYKHASCLALALITLLHLSAAASRRHPRSIWPWSAWQTTEEPLISEKHAEILRQAGHGHLLDLSSHPIWKIHKYEGIDLKPVELETATIASSSAEAAGGENSPQLPRVDARNPVSSESAESGLFGDFGLLSYLVPDLGFGSGGEDGDEDEAEKAAALAGAIRDEEQSHPGFLGKLWSKLWGSGETAEQTRSGQGLVGLPETIALPPTRQRYAEVTLIQPPSHSAFSAGAVAQQQVSAAVVQPVEHWYPNQQPHHSQSYIQSWNPNAAYQVQVAGPSEYPAEHVATVQAYTADHFQRKVSDKQQQQEDDDSQGSVRVAKSKGAEPQGQAQRIADDSESQAKNASEWESVKRSIAYALSLKQIPNKVSSKLRRIQQLINDKAAGQESIDELKRLQDEFEAKKKHLGPFYPMIRNNFPPIPTAPMSQ